MKSICIVAQAVYDTDARVRRKAEALVSAGYSVDVLALAPPANDRCSDPYELNGVRVYSLRLGKARGSLARYVFEYAAFFLWTLVRLPALMRRRRYAVVDVNTLPDFLVFAAVFGKWMGAKVVLDMHEITPEFYMSKYGVSRDSVVIRLMTFLERVSFGFADRVITINHPIQDLLIGRGLKGSKSVVLMNSVDEARFATVSPLPTAIAPGVKRFVMMYHGTLTALYGLDIAIEAFALANEQMPGAELWILGSGPEQWRLTELAVARGLGVKVRIVGQVPPEDIPHWLNECDLGILPIRRDVFLDFAFPNKLPEFIVARRPVLVTRLRGIHHYFSEKALAYVEPNSPRALAERMEQLFADPVWRMRLVNRASEEYEPLRWRVMKQRYLKLVGGLAGASASAHLSPAEKQSDLAV